MSKKLFQQFTISNASTEESSDDLNFFSSLKKDGIIKDHQDGQLAVDVAETDNEIVIVALAAGALKEKIELHLHNDLLTIRGERKSPFPENAKYYFSECYWGKFSRSIILPEDVHLELARAEYRFGLLIIHLPKIKTDKTIKIEIVEE